jgi:hypothetical protein
MVKKNWLTLVILMLFTQFASGIELKSQQLRLVFASEKHGMGLLKAEDLVNKANFLVASNAAPLLWQIELTKIGSDQVTTVIDNRTPANCQIKKIGKKQLQFCWEKIRIGNDSNALSVELTINMNDAGESEWVLKPKLHNDNYTFGSSVFPCVENAIKPAQEKILFPAGNNGSRIVNQPISGTYPSYQAQLQFFGILGNGGGIYLGLHDGNAAIKFFELDKSMRLLVRNYGMDTSVAGKSRCPEYPVVIAVANTPWACCAIYRKWASKQIWTRRGKLSERELPPSAKDIGLWLNSDGDPAPVAACAANEAKLQKYTTAVHWYCWMVHPFDHNYPDFFPPKPGFKKAVDKMRKAGMFVVPYLNGRLWDTKLKSFESVRSEASTRVNGSTIIEDYGSGTKLGAMCSTSPSYGKKLSEAITTLVERYDVNGIYIDQIASAAPTMCYNPKHGHPLGGGGWWQQGYRKMMEPIVKRYAKKALFVSENAAEPYIDSFDTFLVWVQVYTDDFPSLMAVYNQYAWYMCSPTLPQDDLQSFAGLMSRCLLWNIQPGWLRWLHGVNLEKVSDVKFKRAYIDRLVNMRHQAQAVMADGILVDDLKLSGPADTLTLTYHRNGNYGHEKVVRGQFPSHYGTVWCSGNNEMMMMAISELSGIKRKCSFVLNPEQYQVKSAGKAIYRVFEDGSLLLAGKPGEKVNVDLAAYGLQLYILK